MARRVRPPDDVDGLPHRPYYVDAYAVATPRAGDRTARDWADAILGAAHPTVVTAIRAAQRLMGLRLVDPEPPNLAIGWAVLDDRPDRVLLGVDGLVYTPRVALVVRDGALLLVTTVEPHGWVGRVVWALGAPLHRTGARALTAAAERVAG